MKKIILTAITFFGLASLAMAQVPAYVPTNGLVGWWPFSSNTNDLSLNSNNAVNNGATLTTDRFGNSNSAYSFNGINNKIILPVGFTTGSAPKSFAVWFYLNIGSYNWILDGGSSINGNSFGLFWNTNATINKLTFHGDGANYDYEFANINFNQWCHTVITYDGTSVKAYLNDIYIGSISTTLSTFNTPVINVGCRNNNTGYFLGKIDDIGIWNRPLTPCEITQLYNASVFTTPTITSIGSTTLCSGKTATLSASATGSYSWSNGATTQSITVSSAGSYSVSVSNGNCTGNAPPILISVNALPTISVTSGTICNGQSFTITPNGASTYTIQGGSAVKTPTTSTSYTVIGTSSLGCVSQSAATSSVTVNQNPILTVDNLTICAGQSATLNASGATTYTWNTNANTASIVVSPSNTSNYSVSGTSNSCTSTQTVQLLVSACTSIKELQAEQQLSISPNPNSGEFIITAETSMQINISDHLGRHIKTIEVKPGKNAYQLNDLSIGVYLLSGEANGKIYKSKMVIN